MKSCCLSGLLVVSVAISCANAGVPWNPYGVAGHISANNLERLGFPDGLDTYSWDSFPPDLRYQMVRPYHYWSRVFGIGPNYIQVWETYQAYDKPQGWFTQTNYPTDDPWTVRRALNQLLIRHWGYYLDRTGGNIVGQIGLPPQMLPQWYLDAGGNHQQRFEAWILAHPNKIWLLGNEPECAETHAELGTQDSLIDREYVVFCHIYIEAIKALDPNAIFANAGLAMTTKPTWREQFTVENVIATWERVLDIYATQYGEELPLDIWNLHIYSGHSSTNPGPYRQNFITDIRAFSNFARTTRGGVYRDCPVILTEFNGNYGATYPPTREEVVAFMIDFERDLHRLRIEGVLNQWFWFVSSGGTGWPTVSILEGGELTSVGEKYRDMAWTWENLAPPLYQRYGADHEPFASNGFGLWTRKLETSGAPDNSIQPQSSDPAHATVYVFPGPPQAWEMTMMVQDHLAGRESFTFLEGQGAGLELAFTADNATENGLYLGYRFGNAGADDGEVGIVLRAEAGQAANTTILDASTGFILREGVDFTREHKIYFVVSSAGGIDLHLDEDHVAPLAMGSLSPANVNQLRFGSNSRDAHGGVRFRGVVRVYAYAVDDDILASPMTIERRRQPFLRVY